MGGHSSPSCAGLALTLVHGPCGLGRLHPTNVVLALPCHTDGAAGVPDPRWRLSAYPTWTENAGPTLVVTVDVSSPGVLSVGTLAVLVTVPVWVVLTRMKIGPKVWPTARVPTLQVM